MSVPVNTELRCGACEPVGQHGGEGFHGNRGLSPSSTSVGTFDPPSPPRDSWKPFCYLLEDGPFEVLLVNARHVKNLPGRKSDVCDAAWLAQLGASGLVRGSFVPPEPILQLPDLTPTRNAGLRQRAREIQRLEKLLEDAGIKLSSVATDITGVSRRAMLEALINGQRDPAELADLARRRLPRPPKN